MGKNNHSPPSLCPVCSSVKVVQFFGIGHVPIHCNLLWAEREEALHAPKGAIQLGFCPDCEHVFNLAFDPKLTQYSQAYENSLHFSPRFQEYARSLARRLVGSYGLYGKDIIEIGSGQGDFLRLLCELGGNRGLGFDPSYGHQTHNAVASDHVKFIPDFYSDRYTSYQADLICCRHVLEHVERPADFLASVRRAIGDRLDTAVYFEVPNVSFTLRELAIWDVIYEHYSYFSQRSLVHAFRRCGFAVIGVREAFAGQFLGIEAAPAQEADGSADAEDDGTKDMADDVAAFGARYRDKVQTWQRRLREFRETGKRAVVWGAGSKGVTFLNALEVQDEIEVVVDINPRKQGKYIAGTGQRIVPPEFLREYRPDAVVVMNPVYLHEIGQTAKSLGLEAQLEPA